MPAFGKSLSPAETTALTRFLRTLRGYGLRPAEVPAMQLGTDQQALPQQRHGDPSLDLPHP